MGWKLDGGLTRCEVLVRVPRHIQQLSDIQPKEVIGVTDQPSHSTRDEITLVLAHLADRAGAERKRTLDPIIVISIHRVLAELRRHIPGLYAPPDQDTAAALASASADALRRGKVCTALSRALRGLSFSPHHPELWYLAGSACLQFGAAEIAIRSLQHCLWIHPGHEPAQRDLVAMAEFNDFSELQDPADLESESDHSGDQRYRTDRHDEHYDDDRNSIRDEDEDTI